MQLRADAGVGLQHLAGDLGVPRLVGADQTELVTSEERHQAIQQEEEGDDAKDQQLAKHGCAGQFVAAFLSLLQRAGCGCF